ncbi:MAG: PKD domain-containing protein [Sediminibacterium sp.]|nr:PKD domain-containing protein [Sediminibacterium sp.]
MKKIAVLFFLTIPLLNSFSQKWVEMMQDPNANFYDIQREFNAYWKDRPYERGRGYRAFRRWEWFMQQRVYPSGDMKLASRSLAIEKYNEYLAEQSTNKTSSAMAAVSATTANWTPLGPFGSPVGGDAGRLQCIRFMPGNSSIVFVGTAAGGLWKTTNNGASWTTTTDQLASLGIGDIAIDPQNTNIMYIATGDNDAGDTYATGVLKSTNGGVTWNTTGLTWATSLQRRPGRLLINPQNSNSLLFASSAGIFRSLDGGSNWMSVASGYFRDMEYKPGDTTVVYAVTNGSCVKSTNGGASFAGVTIAPSLSVNRLSIAVTPANPNYVYILCSATNNGFGGLYRSTNSASSFSLMSSSPNIFDWSTNGAGGGPSAGQGWYDIAIGVSPVNADYIVAGGVNTWRSTNGGVTWTLNTHWYGGGGKPYVHADLHDVQWTSGSTIYLGHDGGISVSTNTNSTWTTINGNMNIAQIYRMGQSTSTPSLIITGHQDNGTNLYNGAGWSETMGGDGMDCFVSWNNNSVMVGSQYEGSFNRSTNGGASWSGITNGLTGTAAWVAPIIQDPVNANTFYCGYERVYKSTNQGTTWTALGTGNLGTINHIAVAPSNNNVIYASAGAGIFKSTNGGASWGSIAAGLPNLTITRIAVDNQNENNVWITFSGFSSGNKVFESNNGGSTWTNYSNGLPNIPANCIVHKKNSPKVLYVGTDVGVYYREASMSSWMPYFQGLPNVVVADLEIYYPTNKLRAATYGRGVWETDLYSNPSAAPNAYFSGLYSSACINLPFSLVDGSSNNPTSWQWNFQGASISSSTLQNPSVTYTATGTYTASLIATNGNGASSPYVATITVSGPPTAAANNPTVCGNQSGIITLTTNATTVAWSNSATGSVVSVSGANNTVFTYTASIGACNTTGNATLFVSQAPAIPSVLVNGNILSSSVTAPLYQWYLNGSVIPGATSQTYQPTASGWYSVWLDNGTGCSSSSQSVYYDITTDINEAFMLISSLQIAPNPVKENMLVQFSAISENLISYKIVNILGQEVKRGQLKNTSSEPAQINLDGLANGTYDISFSVGKASKSYKFIKN